MKIMVFDVPASSGGALTILNQYYHTAVNDKFKEWVFVISTPKLEETDNIKTLNFEWVKKSWFHRLYFDYFIAPKIVKKYGPDEILSLQNVLVPRVKIPQILYFHNILPFAEKRYSIFGNCLFWLYQNIMDKLILSSLRKADRIIVQANWIKKLFIKKGLSENKINVEFPVISNKIENFYSKNKDEQCLFIYPASALSYKNHEIIIQAAILLKEKSIKNYKIIFTLNGNENKLSRKLLKTVKENKLNIEFVGTLSKEILFSYYQKAVLLFSSRIETFGLPLLEARMCHCPVIASDMTFSREILDGYDKSDFFKYDDEKMLSKLIEKYILEDSIYL